MLMLETKHSSKNWLHFLTINVDTWCFTIIQNWRLGCRVYLTVRCQWRWWGWGQSTGLQKDTLCRLPWFHSLPVCNSAAVASVLKVTAGNQWGCDKCEAYLSLSRKSLGLSQVAVCQCVMFPSLNNTSHEPRNGNQTASGTGSCVCMWSFRPVT